MTRAGQTIGHIHAIQTLGAADGPGVRCVVFLRGCPLRCAYCHNPDTWDSAGGTPMAAEAVLQKALRTRAYWGARGGITVSGGEPLVQRDFLCDLLSLARQNGVHTALDTAGALPPGDELALCDLVLLDVKFSTEEQYRAHTRGSLEATLAYLEAAQHAGVPVWIRHVVVPGLTDDAPHLERLSALLRPYTCIQKLELLPFRTLCAHKYQALDLPFPLAETPQTTPAQLEQARATLLRHWDAPM